MGTKTRRYSKRKDVDFLLGKRLEQQIRLEKAIVANDEEEKRKSLRQIMSYERRIQFHKIVEQIEKDLASA